MVQKNIGTLRLKHHLKHQQVGNRNYFFSFSSAGAAASPSAGAAGVPEAAALSAKAHAEKILQQKTEGMEYSKALAELAEAAAQLRAISALRDKIKKMH